MTWVPPWARKDHGTDARARRTSRGSLRSTLFMAPGWDSDEVNESIATDFGLQSRPAEQALTGAIVWHCPRCGIELEPDGLELWCPACEEQIPWAELSGGF